MLITTQTILLKQNPYVVNSSNSSLAFHLLLMTIICSPVCTPYSSFLSDITSSTFSFAHSALEHPSSSSSSPLRFSELLFPLPGLLFLSDVCLAYKSPSSLCFNIISSLRSALAMLSKIEPLHSTLPIHPQPRLNFSPCVCHHQTYYWILSFILFSSFLSLEDKLQKGRKFCLLYAVSYPWCLENSWNIQNV